MNVAGWVGVCRSDILYSETEGCSKDSLSCHYDHKGMSYFTVWVYTTHYTLGRHIKGKFFSRERCSKGVLSIIKPLRV